jgi:hypothetical protein
LENVAGVVEWLKWILQHAHANPEDEEETAELEAVPSNENPVQST